MKKPIATLLSDAASVRLLGEILMLPVAFTTDWHKATASRWIWTEGDGQHVLPLLGVIRGLLAPLGLAPQVLRGPTGLVCGIALHVVQKGAQFIRSQPDLCEEVVDEYEEPAGPFDTLPPDGGPDSGVRQRFPINDVDSWVEALGGEDDDPDAVLRRIEKFDQAAVKAYAGAVATWMEENGKATVDDTRSALEVMLRGGMMSNGAVLASTSMPTAYWRLVRTLAHAAGGYWRREGMVSAFVRMTSNRFAVEEP